MSCENQISRPGPRAAAGSALRLLLAEYQVHNPAPANVWAGTAAVGEDVGVLASRVLERVRENRHRGELARLVHLAGERQSGIGVP